MSLKIKVCGMREPYNLSALCQIPVDYVGLIFYEKSPRYVEEEGISNDLQGPLYRLMSSLPKINKVGVFVNAALEYVLEKVDQYQLDYVQLHGQENLFYCQQLQAKKVKIIKAFSIDEHFVFSNTTSFQYYCDYFLFDTKGLQPGGNGVSFDWSLLEKYDGETPFFLSGGINPTMVEELKSLNIPKLHALDLNSGFEINPGFKDVDLLATFIRQVA